MFSFCSRSANRNQTTLQHGAVGKQIKGGYLLRYKRHVLWSRWHEEWVVLYDDSTMAWFTEPGRSSPAGKCLVKEAPEMLAIAHWTGQIPRRPPLPPGCDVTQLIALGSRRKRSKVYWMLAQSEHEVNEWISAITKTLPPPPQIELVMEKPHLIGALKRPLVRIRPATSTEVSARRSREQQLLDSAHGGGLRTGGGGTNRDDPESTVPAAAGRSDTAVAVLRSGGPLGVTGSSLGSSLSWGHGWGWSTLPNGVWSGGLSWSQCDDAFTLHALPTTHCTNLVECSGATYGAASGNVFHTDVGYGGYGGLGSAIEEIGAGDDFDYAMDIGDCLF